MASILPSFPHITHGGKTISIDDATFADLANFALHILTAIAYPLAFLAIVYSAYLLITSMGNPDAWTKAKKNVSYILTGTFLIVFAFLIVNFVISLFAI